MERAYMKRRDMLRVTTAGTVMPAVIAAQATRPTPVKPVSPPGSTAASPARKPAWNPQTFTPAQNEAVIALTEAIIPTTDTAGAKEAKVNEYIDLFLNTGPTAERKRFLDGLAWLEQYSTQQHGKSFAKLSAEQQNTLLGKLDEGNNPEVEPGHQFFRMAKQLTSRVYYNTAIGYRELNKGGRVPSGFGCNHTNHGTA